jgi:hypothetical protein
MTKPRPLVTQFDYECIGRPAGTQTKLLPTGGLEPGPAWIEELINGLLAQPGRPRRAKAVQDLCSGPLPEELEIPDRWLQAYRSKAPLLATITEVLRANEGPMYMAEIYAAVEVRLGKPVSRPSIKNCLSRNSSGDSPRFERVDRGSYCLTPDRTALSGPRSAKRKPEG